jgi:hypothetical protein
VEESPMSKKIVSNDGVTKFSNIHILVKYLNDVVSHVVFEFLIRWLKEETITSLDFYLP